MNETLVEIIYYKNSDLILSKKEIHPDGFFTIRIYDKKGNQKILINSNGYIAERTYNEKGEQLTYKNSDGCFKERNEDAYYTNKGHQTKLL